MRLSTKGRYAVTAMMDLAIHEDSGPVTLADISLCQDISLSYLEQLMSQLRRHDLVRGMRGPGGGYSLSRPASEISVADIITAVDEPLQATRCGGEENCQEGERCLTHELWNDLSHRLYEFLDGITLDAYVQREDVQEVIRRQKSRQGQRNNMRRIRAA
ncbi:MAG: Rrf2 family transcriptional regulator [Thiohalospira sp.]|uniref:Rrf2 family transcriptional regulator n=1 Tax=Thiohalospira sp. TaxID=3080549 RepID=UPI0039808DEC